MRIVAVLVLGCWSSVLLAVEVVRTDHLSSSLVSQSASAVPGQPLVLGLLLEHDPGWHTYWQNPGDSGLPTRLQVTVEGGAAQPVEPQWPLPERIPLDERLVNFGYKGRTLLPFMVTVPADATGSVQIALEASWLVCREACIPGRGEYRLSLPLSTTLAGPVANPDFDRAARRQPRQLPPGSDYAVQGDQLVLRLPRQTFPGHPRAWTFFPLTTEVVQNSVEPRWQRHGRYWQASLPKSEFFNGAPARFDWLLVQGDDGIRVSAGLRAEP